MQRGKSILLIEDEADFRSAVRLRLESHGYSVLEAGNGLNAVELVVENRPDLVILDVTLPGENGFSVAKRLKADALCADVPILMLRVCAQDGDRQRGIESGADSYITKPFEPDELIRAIGKLV